MNMKNIKHEIRDRLPDILYSICWQRKNLWKVFHQRKTIKSLNRRKRGYPKPKIVFFLQFPEVWNSFKTIYEAALKDDAEVMVLCAKKPVVNGHFEEGLMDKNEAFEFCEKREIRAIDAYDEIAGKWSDLEAYSPDFVFYARPYNNEIPPLYRSYNVMKYAKLCQVNYGADVGINILNGNSVLSPNFTCNVYFRFLSSERWLKRYTRQYALQIKLKSNIVKVLGTPRYDIKLNSETKGKVSTIHTVAWLPRWVMSESEENIKSHFFDYIYKLVEYFENKPEVQLIIRPHPLMWHEIVNVGILTKDEVEELKKQIESIENISIDYGKDYSATLGKADILLADYTSLIMEYYITGKPIIYCGSIPDNVSKETKKIFESLYLAESWESVRKQMEDLLCGDDVMKYERQNLINTVLPSNAGHIGQDIYQCLLQDYLKYHYISIY